MSDKIKITTITERRMLPVTTGYMVGSSPRVEVDVCVTCGAVVFDPVQHDIWHEAQPKDGEK